MRLKVWPEYLYYYLLILMLVNNWWGDMTVFPQLYDFVKPIILGFAVILLLFLFITQKYKLREIIIILALIYVGAYTATLIGSKWTLYSMMLVAFARNIDIDRAMNIILKCMTVFIAVSLCIFLLQLIFAPSDVKVLVDGTHRKYYMSFLAANEAARYWVFWFMSYMYVNMETQILSYKKIIIFIVTIIFYVCTRSDTLLLVVFLACSKSLKDRKWFRVIIERFAGYSFGFMGLFSLILLKFQGTWIFSILDKFSTGRFGLGVLGFNTYNLSLFGQPDLRFYDWITGANRRLVLDNAYYMLIIMYGLFYFILISAIFFTARKRYDYKSALCVLSYSLYALAANTILSPTAIFPVIIAANLIWNKREIK